MKNKSKSLRGELEKLNARLAELQPQFDKASAKFEADEKAFTAGKLSFDGLKESRRDFDLISNAVSSLLERSASLINEIAAAEAEEARVLRIDNLKSHVAGIEEQYKVCVKSRAELGKIASTAASDEVNFLERKRAFGDAVRGIIPIDNLTRPLKKHRKEFEQFMTDLKAAGITEEQYTLAAQFGSGLPDDDMFAADMARKAVEWQWHVMQRAAAAEHGRRRDEAARNHERIQIAAAKAEKAEADRIAEKHRMVSFS